ncbi:MAG: GNAT family N-acetyltransferase [Gammaproteobacteria bacterium]|nr:GNAT family N-acetyltransferase [Gammaproteobacteria bacterium]
MQQTLNLSDIDWQWRHYNALTRDEAVAMFKLRQDVFIVEQDCPFHDIDGIDSEAEHLLGWYDGELVATLRFFHEYQPYQGRCSIGRICSSLNYRKFGVGRALVAEGLKRIDELYSNRETEIGAQLYLKKFYESFGFVQSSDVYDEDGIDHIHMIRAKLVES